MRSLRGKTMAADARLHRLWPAARSPLGRAGVFAVLGAAILCLACSHHATQPKTPPVTPTNQWLNDRPAWSPSGRYLLYNHYAQTASEVDSLGQYQIWLFDLSTGERRYIFPAVQPQWLGSDNAFTFALAYVGGVYIYSIGSAQTHGLWTCGDLSFDA